MTDQTFLDHPNEVRAYTAARLRLAHIAPHHRAISPIIVEDAVRLIDFIIAMGLGLLVAIAYHVDSFALTDPYYLLFTSLAGLSLTVTLSISRRYSVHQFVRPIEQIRTIIIFWTMTFALLGTVIFFLKAGQETSRAWLAIWYVAGLAVFSFERRVLAKITQSWIQSGRLTRRAVIYGAGQITRSLIRDLEADVDCDLGIVGLFDDRDSERTGSEIDGYRRLGNLDDCLRVSRAMGVDLVLVALPVSAETRLATIAGRLSVLPADIKLPAAASKIRFSPKIYSKVGAVAMIDLYDRPISDWNHVAKWVFDKTIGLLALALLWPVMALVAIAIKLDSRGPVLFRQNRYGFNNELIEVYKFRSMYVDQADAGAAKLVTKDDPRVTRVGRFIRKSSLDELPQLFNVLKGDLSLVGPRPHAVSAKAGAVLYNDAVKNYFARHKVKPGITGWAQINGWRGETDTHEKIAKRVEYDLYYIDNWSVLFDLSILLKTPLALLKTDNAY